VSDKTSEKARNYYGGNDGRLVQISDHTLPE
jgi:hypothetical protein